MCKYGTFVTVVLQIEFTDFRISSCFEGKVNLKDVHIDNTMIIECVLRISSYLISIELWNAVWCVCLLTMGPENIDYIMKDHSTCFYKLKIERQVLLFSHVGESGTF